MPSGCKASGGLSCACCQEDWRTTAGAGVGAGVGAGAGAGAGRGAGAGAGAVLIVDPRARGVSPLTVFV